MITESKHGREIMRFCQVFPVWAGEIVKWTPNKDGSVKIELTDKRFFIFMFIDERTWKLETVRMHAREEKEGTRA